MLLKQVMKCQSVSFFTKCHVLSDPTYCNVFSPGTQKIYWNIFYCNDGNCINSSRFNLEDARLQDLWLGFYEISAQYNPYEDVVESLLIIKDLSPTDNYEVGCSFEEEHVLDKSETFSVRGPIGDGSLDTWDYFVLYVIYFPTLCFVILLMLMAFGIAACCRAKVCRCTGLPALHR